jgi:hypothetical protein
MFVKTLEQIGAVMGMGRGLLGPSSARVSTSRYRGIHATENGDRCQIGVPGAEATSMIGSFW